MNSIHPINTLRVASAAFAILVAVPAMIFAQGVTFTDCDAWETAVCGSVLDDDFESFVDENGDSYGDNFGGPIPTPQSVVWGEVSQDGNNSAAISFQASTSFPISKGIIFDVGGEDGTGPAVFTPNTAALGPLEGVCFSYLTDDNDSVITFNAYDGETLVASFPLPNAPDDDTGKPVASTFGWQNTEGLNVTRFEFAIEKSETSTIDPIGVVGDGQLSFGEGCDPPEVSCFDQLADIKADLADFVGTLSGNDAYFAQGALDCIDWMQHDCFWEQPSGNRLTRYGGSLFIGAAYTVAYLEWIDDPEADVLIDELVAVLECLVDHEIAYAIANGGNTCYIDRAEDYAELGNIIDEDFDNEVVATLAYRLAWLHAYYATQ